MFTLTFNLITRFIHVSDYRNFGLMKEWNLFIYSLSLVSVSLKGVHSLKCKILLYHQKEIIAQLKKLRSFSLKMLFVWVKLDLWFRSYGQFKRDSFYV